MYSQRFPRFGDHGVACSPLFVEELQGEVLPPRRWRHRRRVAGRPLRAFGPCRRRSACSIRSCERCICLNPCLWEHGGDRLGEPGEPIDAGDQDVGDAALVQIVEDGEPELGALALLPPDPEHFTLAFHRDPIAR